MTQLKELVTALDRRIPHVARAGEQKIAQEAAALRHAALARLSELARVGGQAQDVTSHEVGGSHRKAPNHAGSPKPQQQGAGTLFSFEPAYTD